MDALRDLPKHMKRVKKTSHVPAGFYHKGIIKHNDQFHEYPRLAFLRDTYAALTDEVITAMAGKYTLGLNEVEADLCRLCSTDGGCRTHHQ